MCHIDKFRFSKNWLGFITERALKARLYGIKFSIFFCSLQNVLSKKMLSLYKVKLNPGEIQYYTAVASVFAQIPVFIIFVSHEGWQDFANLDRAAIYIFNGVCFHFQTLSGYALMDSVSPVTHR